jgi:hypothetical protein
MAAEHSRNQQPSAKDTKRKRKRIKQGSSQKHDQDRADDHTNQTKPKQTSAPSIHGSSSQPTTINISSTK